MSLKLKAKELWGKLSQKSKDAGKKLTVMLVVAGALCSLGLLAANAPAIHKSWIRSSVGDNVFMIALRDDSGQIAGGGTGFMVTAPSGVNYILTNAHVCEAFPDGTLQVRLKDGRFVPRRIIEVSDKTDLCLAEGLAGYKGLKLADEVKIGQTLHIVGYPVLQPLSVEDGEVVGKSLVEFPYAIIIDDEEAELEEELETYAGGAMTTKECSSKPKFKVGEFNTWLGPLKVCILSLQAYETTITSFPGNSGSPVVDFWGNLSGVLYAGSSRTNWGLVITLDDVREFLAPY